MKILKEKWEIFYNKLGEVTPACLLMMVQGDITAITSTHFIKAFTTGTFTALAIIVLSLMPNKEYFKDNYMLAGLTAFITMVIDFMVHPSHFGNATMEAVLTGLAAGVLCLIMSKFKNK